eukprot:CAMPEP_0197674096 /NCGR_PEP_ID=MMETSP1338-20131121/82252_1 /TAXON_ID=43686 ORGANISM="Pelagodinium beii, Strain RCC1491" /NCGR_SAMPLE_ID=MMETSP1338 /ASSEMBLY_ACC=CAM_ASM_000754 /LENGTH=442 /DNA_ID=CAMNT_0043254433 /DNA_START=52 /DNA_END=1376 /DNA_ORIENTATION=+
MGCGASLGTRYKKDDDGGVLAEYEHEQTWATPVEQIGVGQRISVINDVDEFRVLRKSDLSGHVTLYVAGGKNKKPVQYASEQRGLCAHEQPRHSEKCPFCPGNEHKTPQNVLVYDAKALGTTLSEQEALAGWVLRVFPNIFPMMICPVAYYGEGYSRSLANISHSVVAEGLHANHKVSSSGKQVDALGVSEVVVESPVHNALFALQQPDRIELLLRALVSRGQALAQQSWAKQILYFKQYGSLSGGSLVHPHTQILSLPIVPPPLLARLEYSLYSYEKKGRRCATCFRCVEEFAGEQSERSRHVHSTKYFVVSVPYSSGSQYCMQIAPKRHSSNFCDATVDELRDLSKLMALLSQVLYTGFDDPSYNMFIRSAPVQFPVHLRGRDISAADTAKCFHWIMELRPRFPADVGGFEIASGVRVVSGLPEDHAEQLRALVQDRIKA